MTTASLWRRALTVATVATAAIALSGCSILSQVTNGINDVVDPGPGTTQDIFSIEVGDCEAISPGEGEISATRTIDCAEPHETEIYAASYVADGEFPGDAFIEEQAINDCTAEFETFIGANYEDSIYDFSWYYPTAGTWAEGDREILCVVYDISGASITGSLQGVAK